ncbi:MAG: hypothetical protein V4632_09765 [Pseudomonadota bacterium]
MAFKLRKTVIRSICLNATVCFGLSAAVGVLSGIWEVGIASLAWPLVLALGMGLLTGWMMVAKIKRNVLRAIPRNITCVRLERGAEINGFSFDWTIFKDLALQLEARGYVHLGEYAPYPLPEKFVGISAFFLDALTSTFIEIRHKQMRRRPTPNRAPSLQGMQISIISIVGGNVRTITTDRIPSARDYLIRGNHDIVAAFPEMPLVSLLAKHQRLLNLLHERTGKNASVGMSVERHVLLQRHCCEQARSRIESMSGYRIARQVDTFEAKPKRKWAPPTATIAALPVISLAELDKSAFAKGEPSILDPGPSSLISTTFLNSPAASGNNVGVEILQKHYS